MLIENLIIKDFLSFQGENRIDFPQDKDGGSLVVVLAENSSGKTNLLRSLRFLLYGEIPGAEEPPGTDMSVEARVVHKAAVLRLAQGESVVGYVEATVRKLNRRHRFRREITVTKGTNRWSTEIVLKWTQYGTDGVGEKMDRHPDILRSGNRKLESLVPRALFDYFYFRGEELADRLASKTKGQSLSQALTQQLYSEQWGEAVKTAQAVHNDIQREIDEFNKSNIEYTRAQQDVQLAELKVTAAKEENDKNEERLAEVMAELRAIDDVKIQALKMRDEYRKQAIEWEAARDAVDAARADQQSSENTLRRLAGRYEGAPFLVSALPRATKILQELKERNLLPAPIAPGFIDRQLLKDTCICGTDWTKAMRAAVEQYKEDALSEKISGTLTNLLNWIEQVLPQQIKTLAEDLPIAEQMRSKARAKMAKAERDLANIKKSAPQPDEGNAEELLRRARTLEAEKASLRTKLERARPQIHLLTEQLQEKRQKRDKLVRKGGGKANLRLANELKAAERVLNLATDSQHWLKRAVYQALQESVASLYDPVVMDRTTAHIDKATLLPRIHRNGQLEPNFGGGQGQLVTLAHIIALSTLRRKLAAQLRAQKVMVPEHDDQSFFLDSVFAPTGPNFARTIAKFLPHKAKQMLVLVAGQQWQESVRETLEKEANAFYRFHLHTDVPPTNEADTKVSVHGASIELVSVDSSYSAPFTKIEPLP